MADDPNVTEQLKAALAGLRKLKARVAELESVARAPIAVIGMGCRFPGGSNDPATFWRHLLDGQDAIGPVPTDRWDLSTWLADAAAEAPALRHGGFLDDVYGFDADHFHISPREARAMDPQQRLLLEVSWEALEHAGRIAGLEGSQTGVFLGVALTDWEQRTLRHPDPGAQDLYAGTGSFNSVAAGRISYTLGLRGPNVSLDTACSSSLVALHLACQSLRAGECEMALAGGVNLLLSPDPTLYFSRMGALAPDGRCKSFDAAADGYVRSEGVGVVVLKRLDDALRDGDRVLAVIRGSAVNQDGRSNGLTAPNPDAQREVLRAALSHAGLAASEVGYVETHGTGTPLGDPIEVDALRAVYGDGDRPLVLGAAKSAVGHAEAAAGVVGFIKAVLAVRHGWIPANLHLHTPNPRLRLEGSRLTLPRVHVAWPAPRTAAVSGFGMSGTNAHVVLTSAPEPQPTTRVRSVQVLVLSGRDEAAREALSVRVADALGHVDGPRAWADACFTAAAGRLATAHRRAIVASTAGEARAALGRGEGLDAEATGARLALEFGDGLDERTLAALRAEEPVFAEAFVRLSAGVADADGLVGLVALAELLAGWGLRPHAVGGVGAGRWAAGVVAGVLPIAVAAKAWRSFGDGRRAVLEQAPLGEARCYLASATTGRLVAAGLDTVDAWMGDEARAEDAVQALRDEGCLIVSAGAVIDGALLAVGPDLPRTFATLLASLWTRGLSVDWRVWQPGTPVDWPLTAFRHSRYHLDDPMDAQRAAAHVDARVWAVVSSAVTLPPLAPRRWCVVAGGARGQAIGRALGTPHALGPDTDVVDATALETPDVAATLALAQRVAAAGARLHVLLPQLAGESDPAVAAVAGLVSVLATELGPRWGGRLAVGDHGADAVADALARADGRDLELTAEGLAEPRLRHAPLGAATWSPRADGVWWVTGGLGAVGLEVAGWLIAQGVTRLVLMGRSGPADAARARLAAWRARGVDVSVVSGDVASPADVARVRAGIPDLRGLIHLAGVVDDAPFASLDATRLEAVLAPKLAGTRLLDAATRDADLDAFVVIGSASDTLGVRGQAAYAAANAAAAAVVRARRAAGFPGVVAEFGPWDVGMADAAVRRRLEAVGVSALPAGEALGLLGRLLSHDGASRLLVRLDADRYGSTNGSTRLSRLLGHAPVAAAPTELAAGRSHRDVATAALAEVLGLDAGAAIDPSRGLFELGLDSMTAVAFAARVERALGRPVPPTLAFDHGTLGGVVAWLDGAGVVQPDVTGPASSEPIAVVGMACRFPGGANDPEAFWDLLVGGRDAIGPVPASRWDAAALYDPTPGTPGRTYVREGAFLDDVASFDAEFFGIAPREARSLDPQQRLLLEVGVEALERAAIPLDGLVKRAVGVFVGIGPSDYARRFDALTGEPDAYAGTGNEASFAAGRLAYALGVQGPAIGLNTACSSSLVTTHLACQALRAGECELALSGGVNLMLSPETTVQLSALHALSPTSRCRTFDADADGYARGEGCGVVVLKRLSDAVRDGDPILAVIRASTVNHDGPSAGLTVPSGDAQARLLTTTLARAGLRGEDVGFLEAHGTGTRLGDPIEVGAVKLAYGTRPADAPLVISSVKTHVGHLELAAGVAGLMSAVLTLRAQTFAPHLHLVRLNPALDLGFPVRLPTVVSPWTSSAPRIASVSSFGLSGTNANLLVEEAPARPDTARRGWVVLPLSARTEVALRGLAARLADSIERVDPPLDAVARTLKTGRSVRGQRAAVVATDRDGAVSALRAIAAGAPIGSAVDWSFAAAPAGPWARAVSPDDTRRFATLIAAWFGAGVPIGLADHAGAGARIELPSTPWTHTRHWVPRVSGESADRVPGAAHLHRLVWSAHPTRHQVSGSWSVITDRGGLGGALVSALRARGQAAELVEASAATGTCVVDLRPCDGGDAVDDTLLRGAFELVQAVAARSARLWVVTRGLSDGHGLAAGGLVGLMRGLARELPSSSGGWIDLVEADVERLADALRDGDPQLRVRAGGVERPTLVHDDGQPLERTHGTWWIAGGLGALGLQVARWLVSIGAERVVLTGRRAPSADVQAAIDALRGAAVVDVRLADLADVGAVGRIAATLGDTLVGVVHAAGALADVTLSRATWAQFAAPLAAKAHGGWSLHLATQHLPLEHFVLFSSAAGTFGWTGQAGYAAANTTLDALALHRHRLGLPATSVAFGPWSGGGMADDRAHAAMASVGMRALAPDDALGALRRALGSSHPTWVAVDLDAALWARSQPHAASLVASLLPAVTVAGTSPLAALPPPERRARVVAIVRDAVADALGHADATALDASRGLFDMGLDSLMAVQVARGLSRRADLVVPDTLAFDAPSIDALVVWVEAQLGEAVAAVSSPVPGAGQAAPIAIVGLACRFPGGADDPESYWALLMGGRDAIVPVPRDRWDVDAFYDPSPGVPGRTYVREGGFLDDVSGFEPGVFGISPKEAARMDPQQRLLLEVSWEALERAGIAPDSLRDSRTGVFVGIGGHDYERVIERAGPADADDGYAGTGNDPAFAAGRISYVFGARGPALSLNTACSSSLVTTHLGVASLRAGESDLVLAGGVRLMLSPEETVRLSSLRALSPHARCRSFDAAADGYVRGEGCGVLVLERLDDARRHGHPVLAVIAGTAVNHDGASGGLTVPSGSAQQGLLRAALDDAGLTGAEVDALEAHGTGTPLGDPIELGAVGAVLGDRPGDRPLLIGSVKTNLGHLELAAGVAGVIKAVLSLQHDTVPASLHFDSWNPRAARDFPVAVATRAVPWARDHRRVMGVSAFGLSGTNAHVLVADPMEPARAPATPRGPEVLVLTAHGADGLRDGQERLARHLGDHPQTSVTDVAWTLATGRAQLPHRRAVVVHDVADAVRALRDPTVGHSGVVRRGRTPARTAFLFTGQGAQHAGMMRGLYDRFPIFRDVVDRCDVALRALRGEGLLPVLFPTAASPIGETAWTQPALYAVEVATAALWRAAGVEPALLVGHSVGELAAATVAGLWSVEDGLAVVEARGRLMQALPRDGAMAAIGADDGTVRAALHGWEGVEIAALNAPEETVISGDVEAVDAIVAEFTGRGARAARLEVSHAFHSRRMEPVLVAFEAVVRATRRVVPTLPIVSNLTGAPEREALVDPAYWVRHVREAVRFAPSVARAVADGVTVFVEVGPHPVLSGLGARTAPDPSLTWLWSARRGAADPDTLLDALARHHATVGDVTWRALVGPTQPAIAPIPTIAWQRTRHWIDGAAATPATAPAPRWTLRWDELRARHATTVDERVWVHGDGPLAARVSAALTTRGAAVVRDGGVPARVVWVCDAAGDDLPGLVAQAANALLGLVQSLARDGIDAPLVIVTRDASIDPIAAAVGALARVIGLEQRRRYGGVVEVLGDVDDTTILDAILDGREDRQRVVGARRLGARLVRDVASPPARLPGRVLVTGGLGAVGLAIARRLVDDGVRQLALNARRAPGPDALAAIDALRAKGATVTVVLGDVAVAADVTRMLAEIDGVGTVIHAAGVLDDGLLASIEPARLAAVLAPKVQGAWNLARLTGDPVRLIFLSSATAWLGAHGQGAYAVANGFLDGLAGRLRAQGRAATSVAFGPWAGAGMARGAVDAMIRRGIRPLAADAAVEALAGVWVDGPPQVAIADADWTVYRPVFDGERPRALLDVVAPDAGVATPAPIAPGARSPAPAPGGSRPELWTLVRAAVAEVLGFADPSRVDPEQGFFELGLDSLMAVTLSERIGARVGLSLSPAVTFDHPTVTRLTTHLRTRLAGPVAAAPVVVRAATVEPVAIVGMACRFPGAPDVDAFWELLVEGRCAVGEAPRARWPGIDALYDPTPGTPGKTYTRAGAFLDDIASFDPLFFGLSPREAEAMDPQQRLMLEVAWEAMEDAAVGLGRLAQSRTGVFVGMGASEYDARFATPDGGPSDAYAGTGNDTSFAAGRIAFHLGVRGPAMTVNTACSASLVALHLACQALRAGECELAIAGGVNLMVAPESHVRLAALRALSPTGVVHAFDAAADGYVRGEGAGAVMLARLSDATARGLRVLAVVRASGVNHDGPSSALTVPSGPAQTELLRDTWARAGITPDDLGYVEAHGTGTRLGDPIEVGALAAALDGRTRPLRIGSVKTNLGHLELAAGAAGLIKTVLALQHGLIPAHLHLQTRNPLIPADLPIDIPTRAVPWEGARVAGVSSFGLSGTNAHVVLEGLAPPRPASAPAHVSVVPLAARTAASLARLAPEVAEALTSASLADVARTAGVGRSDGVFRVAVVGDDAAGVAASLRGASRDGRFEGEVPHDPPKLAWIFSGQGAMGTASDLLAIDRGFADGVDALDAALAPELGGSVRAALERGEGLDRPALAAAALTAFQVVLAARLEAWGVVPDLLLGHGAGEAAAAVSAGVWTAAEAVRFSAERARIIDRTAPGRMVAVRASEAVVRQALAGRSDVDVAAVNGPDAVVLAGSEAGVAAVVAALGAVDVIGLPDTRAPHSPSVDGALDALRGAAGRAHLRPATRPLVVAHLARVDAQALATADGWATAARAPVRFSDSAAALTGAGATLLVEIGPQPQLLGTLRRAIDPRGRVIAGAHRSDRGWATLAETLAHLWVRGVPVDWEQVSSVTGGQRVSLPSTPFVRRRLWIGP